MPLLRNGSAVVLLIGATAAAPFVSMLVGNGWAGIVLAGTSAWLWLRAHLHLSRRHVVSVLLLWAATIALTVGAFTALRPNAAAAIVPHGTAYWEEMRPWLATGVGNESDPGRFVPQHALHLAGFVLLALVTGGWAGLLLGAWLLGYMSFYVGQVAAGAAHPVAAFVLAWAPWAMLRVIAFVMLGVSLSRVLLERPAPARFLAEERGPLFVAAVLWVVDLLLKTLFAPHWPALLRGL